MSLVRRESVHWIIREIIGKETWRNLLEFAQISRAQQTSLPTSRENTARLICTNVRYLPVVNTFILKSREKLDVVIFTQLLQNERFQVSKFQKLPKKWKKEIFFFLVRLAWIFVMAYLAIADFLNVWFLLSLFVFCLFFPVCYYVFVDDLWFSAVIFLRSQIFPDRLKNNLI